MTARRWAWKQASFKESIIAHWSSSMALKMSLGSSVNSETFCQSGKTGMAEMRNSYLRLVTAIWRAYTFFYYLKALLGPAASRVYKPFSFQCLPLSRGLERAYRHTREFVYSHDSCHSEQGEQVEYTRALERTMLKELDKMTQVWHMLGAGRSKGEV
ncbi:hypothetical protein E5676_scaffold323G00860 [Cucumis melo var. makuwa]|uniref:Uncharacterized protein n=1 Tax=Cucumis melo var. makuwa TaxID=1194695 RepID=A0A5D3CBD6_CUCMM|nr:hypothetical protein E6C27_scaffold404G00540 [Cucumis melo var. makuwa]TYK08544.1 hypothetical protein E5676_scaffold323G00860 [Cucumis melo var. makuwa]